LKIQEHDYNRTSNRKNHRRTKFNNNEERRDKHLLEGFQAKSKLVFPLLTGYDEYEKLVKDSIG
jgi:hypothetical protein